jgi:hypothetical protein
MKVIHWNVSTDKFQDARGQSGQVQSRLKVLDKMEKIELPKKDAGREIPLSFLRDPTNRWPSFRTCTRVTARV